MNDQNNVAQIGQDQDSLSSLSPISTNTFLYKKGAKYV